MFSITAKDLLLIIKMTLFLNFQTRLRLANAGLERELERCRTQIRSKDSKIEKLETKISKLNTDNRELDDQNVAACDAKTALELGLIRGTPQLTILQDCHKKLMRVTPDMVYESDDEESIPIINLHNRFLAEKSTQTDF